jgi:hypothetical protein
VKLQKILVELGYFAPFTPGVFDTATQELLWRIQLEENMKPNGLCDSATITLLVQKYFEYTVRKRGN